MIRFALLLFISVAASAQHQINVAGTFNDWNPTNTTYRMSPVSDQELELRRFFNAGRHQFKFAFDGGWEKNWGDGPGGKLVNHGKDIPLRILKPGGYRISLNLAERVWKIEDAPLDAPHAVVEVRGPVEINIPITLDAAGSVAREGRDVRVYEFRQDTNDTVQARLVHANRTAPAALVYLPAVGDYRFWVRVGDAPDEWSAPELVTLKAETSYQIVGDWTGSKPTDPDTFLQRTGPTTFEKILKSEEPGEQQLILIKDHDEGNIVANLTVSITQTNPAGSGAGRQFWRVRYDEKSRQFTCEAEPIVEFVYRPDDDPILSGRVRVETVHVAGSFNGWSTSSHPMTDRGDGTFVTYLTLEDGLHHYKFVVNSDGWMQDPNSDPELRAADGHGGFNSGVFVGQHGKEFGPPPPGDVNLAAVSHSPEHARDFNVITSDSVDVRLRVLQRDAQRVTVNVDSRAIPMRVGERAFGFDYWIATVETTNRTLRYSFTLADGEATQTFGPFEAEMVVRFPTPEWAKHVTWYQIFPERFRNGTPANDPPGTLPWRHDWYKLGPGERWSDERRIFSNDWYNRRFGGDLQGLIEKLPYFRELGVTALYFCPVFESGSNHGYDTHDYRHVSRYFGVKEELPADETLDPATWQWTESDKVFLEFIRRAKAQGLKVIVDGVFNHMGKGNFALNDVLTNGVNSIYADWFDVTDWGPPVKYKSWDGGGWMPNFRKDSEHGIASESARKYLFDITRRWMDPNGDGDPSDGIDGWRLDVAPDVPPAFWRAWRKHVKSINPEAYIVGEDWGVATAFLQGDQWDATMNYQFAMRAINFFIDKKRKISASEFDRRLKELLATYPMQVNYVMQNLYNSHDTDRLVNMVVNPDRDYDGCNRPQDHCPYDASKPGADAYRVMKLMATFQMAFLGAPMIWYGDEAGMFGADDPTDRKPMLWKDLQPYDNPQDFVMDDVWNHYARVVAIRNTYRALRTGNYEAILTDDERDLFGFARRRGDETVVAIFNNSDKEVFSEFAVPFPNNSKVVDLMTAPVTLYDAPLSALGFPQFDPNATARAVRISPHAPALLIREGKVRLRLPAKTAAILVRR